MSRKDISTSVSIPLSLIIVGTLLGYLLPEIGSVEKFLLSYLKYRWSVWVLITSSFLLATLFPYYSYTRATRPLNKKERANVIKNIKDMVEAQYSIHRRNVLTKSFEKMLNKEAARGFTRPTGTLSVVVSDLYLSEVGVFSSLLEKSISKGTLSAKDKALRRDLSVLITELLTKHNAIIKGLFNSFSRNYYRDTGPEHIETMNARFTFHVDAETRQRIKYLLSVNNLDEIT